MEDNDFDGGDYGIYLPDDGDYYSDDDVSEKQPISIGDFRIY
jgi:hypothetical protein